MADGEDVDWERVRSSAGSKREQDSIDARSSTKVLGSLLSKLVQVFGEAPAVPEPTRPGRSTAPVRRARRRRPGSRDVGLSPDSRQARSGDVRETVCPAPGKPELNRAVALKLFPRAEAGRRDVS